MAGRKPKLTAAILEEASRGIRAGASVAVVFDALGIHRSTAFRWLALGEAARRCAQRRCRDEHHGPRGEVSYELFAIEIQKAIGQAGLRAAASVSAQFQKDPRFAERWLAKRYAEDFGPRADVRREERATEAPFVIQLVPSDRPQEEIDAFMREIPSPRQAEPPAVARTHE